jgi:hypothetical protein
MFPWVAATLFGALAPALIYAGLEQDVRVLPLAFIVTLAHAVILGLPVALLYRAKRWTRLSAVLVGAILIGIIPQSFFATATRILQSVVITGALGAVGGFMFWLTLKSCGLLALSDGGATKSTPTQRRIGAALAGAAVLASLAVAAIPSFTREPAEVTRKQLPSSGRP